MKTDEWVEVALTDDEVVVELLLRLKQSSESEAMQAPPQLAPPAGWGQRQPRSKPTFTAAKENELMRCSPTTPLSWSGGGGASSSDGSERSSGDRSKGSFACEEAALNQRSRRKKTFAQLKEEESLLLKERTHLKKEIATLHLTFTEQKAASENLKRLKLDLYSQSAANETRERSSPDCEPVSSSTIPRPPPAPGSCGAAEKEAAETREKCFILPDLNMMPSAEDSSCESLYGLS
ncbi:uncharacterized protein LOC127813738 [Diospyros lotus]|uniref:uncharacterized protein LOC127813738 n=1 Tax=Diospyros lotus TaxID=55363 RepID=UPI00225B3123|nr:uncharacterized protein LOC127813738 [Diospyros lotus]